MKGVCGSEVYPNGDAEHLEMKHGVFCSVAHCDCCYLSHYKYSINIGAHMPHLDAIHSLCHCEL